MRYRHYLACAMLACAVLPAGGCFWVAVGGAGATGYAVGKDERSVGTIVDDATITSTVKTRLVQDAEIKALNINVDTYQGIVTLHGDVASDALLKRAVQIASAVKGVREVRSSLVVVPDSE